MAVSLGDKPLSADELVPVGPIVKQDESEMRKELITTGFGGVLTATREHMTTWYHNKTGEVSVLPTILDATYQNKPDFNREPNENWYEQQKNAVQCPACDAMVRIIPEVDNKAMLALGFKIENEEQEKRRFLLEHFKASHKRTFAQMLQSGQVSETEAKNL